MWSACLVVGTTGVDESACGSLWARGEQATFRPGDILLTNAGEVLKTTAEKGANTYFTIFWDRASWERAGSHIGIAGTPHWSQALLQARPVALLLTQLREALEAGADARTVERAYWAATTALLREAAQSQELARTPCHPGVRRAAAYASANLSEPRPLEQMAREVQMSKCHLVRCFQSTIGVPPHRFRTLLRLERARRLLESGLSVAEVASQTGFADAPHLTRSFREWLGVSPAAWGNVWRASDPWSERRPRTVPPPAAR